MTPAAPRVLVSYRRADAAGAAGRIFDRLAACYGRPAVFMDVDSIPLGHDFRAHIHQHLTRCSVALVIVGPRWLGPREGAPARIRDADDPVRVEVETALASKVPIIPVLVEGAAMPKAEELPESLAAFSYLNAARVDSAIDFHQHTDRLIAAIDQLTGLAAGARLRLFERGRLGWGAVMAASLAMPFAASLASLAPPWPPGVVVITTAVALVAMVAGAQFMRRAPLVSLHRVLMLSAVLLLVTMCSYLLAVAFFTYQVPTTRERFARGFTCTKEAQLLYKDKCPNLGVDELQEAEYEADRLWTATSVAVVKVSLVGLWLAVFVAMAALISSLLVRFTRQAGGFTNPGSA